MFPRIVLHDGRGTFISLSHFCPTAAALLFAEAGDATIVSAPGPLANVGELDGLDARGVWPPLLREGVLMDLESYAAWEREAIALLARGDGSPAERVAELAAVTDRISRWTPGSGALLDTVRASFPRIAAATAGADRERRAITRWLAARLFGTWRAYQGERGLPAIVDYLSTCLDTFTRETAADGNAIEAIRRSDLFLLHRA